MINQIGGFEDVVETAQGAAQAGASSAKKGAANFVNTAIGQVTGSQTPNPSDQGSNETNNAAAVQAQNSKMSDDQAKQFLSDLYGPSKPKSSDQQNPAQNSPPANQNPVAQAIGLTPADPNQGKSPEDLAKIESLRNQLHADYYRDLVNRPKNEPEHVTEKLEREEEQAKFEEIEKDKQKPDPLTTVKQGTGENVVGVSG